MEQLRFDRNPLPRVKRTAEGFYRGDAVVTRTGVFVYTNPDGTTRRELRHPDDVFRADSLNTLHMVPITVNHPKGLVTVETAGELSVGTTGQDARRDGTNVVSSVTVTAQRGIDAMAAGNLELSLGYRLDLVEEAGVYEGEPYTHRQTNIDYNHLAIVPRGRAGAAARLNMDGLAVATQEDAMSDKTLATVHLDGLNYDAAPEVQRHVQRQAEQIATLRADAATAATAAAQALVKVEASRDEHKSRADKAEADLALANDPKRLDAAVAERVALVDGARRLLPAINADGMSTRAIQEAALKALHPTIALDGKTDDYVAARFDAAVESLPQRHDQLDRVAAPVPAGTVPHGRFDARTNADAYEKSITDMNAWRDAV